MAMSDRDEIYDLLDASDELIEILFRPLTLEGLLAQKDQLLFAQFCAFVGMARVMRALLDAGIAPPQGIITDTYKAEMQKFAGMMRDAVDRTKGQSA